MSTIKHYYISFKEVQDPKPGTIATAAIRFCCGCGDMLTAMGGGGQYMCDPCRNTLSTGVLRKEFTDAKR